MSTVFVVYCEMHREYLKHVSVTGTTWRRDQSEAKRFATKPAAQKAAQQATWLDHRPIVWAVNGEQE